MDDVERAYMSGFMLASMGIAYAGADGSIQSGVLLVGAVCCSVLQCVAVCCSVLQCVAVRCSVLQCVSWMGTAYGGATLSRLLQIIGLFCRISSLYRALLQKRPIILRYIIIEATPYANGDGSIPSVCCSVL